MDSEPEFKLMSLLFQLYDLRAIVEDLDDDDDPESHRIYISLLIKVISMVNSIDLESQPESESKLMSLIYQTISCFKSMDLDSQPKQLQEFIQLISEKISLPNSMDSYLEAKSNLKLLELLGETLDLEPEPELISLISQIYSLVKSESKREVPKTEIELGTEPQTELELEFESKFMSLMNQQRDIRNKRDFSWYVDSDSETDWNVESDSNWYITCVIQIISLVCSIDLDTQQKPKSELMSLIFQMISCFKSMDLDYQPKPIREFIRLIYPRISLLNSTYSVLKANSNCKLFSLLCQILRFRRKPRLLTLIIQTDYLVNQKLKPESEPKTELEPETESQTDLELEFVSKFITLMNQQRDIRNSPCFFPYDSSNSDTDSDTDLNPESDYGSKYISCVIQIISLVCSIDLDSQPMPKSELMALIIKLIYRFRSMDLDYQPKPLRQFIQLISPRISLLNSTDSGLEANSDFKLFSLFCQILRFRPKPRLVTLIRDIDYLVEFECKSDSEPESEPELKSLIYQLMSINDVRKEESAPIDDVCRESEWEFTPLVSQLMYLFNTMDLDSKTKRIWESELMSLIKQTTSLFNSMDLDSQPRFISLISQRLYFSSMNADMSAKLGPESELTSLIQEIFSLTISNSKDPEWSELIPLCPKVQVRFEEGKFHVTEEISRSTSNKWNCLPLNWEKFRLAGDETHFLCRGCNGENHAGINKTPVVIKHHLHPKHSLQLVLFQKCEITTRECYCCDKELEELFYYCSACDYAMNIVCVEKPPVLSIDDSKWHHDHPLALFPRLTSLTCNLCALSHSSCPFYMCPPCNLVIHQSCITLPRVIRISRHPHRISFTSSFDQGDWSCGVCRRDIDKKFGGFACNKDGCSYAAHSKCATQSNVWDGVELENMPEEIEEEVIEPFVRISDGSIQHFRHQQHYLRLDMNTGRDYDENKQCQACFTPIYFGNFYSCIECDYILHEECAELSRKIYHPIHPHLLTLVGGYNSDMITKRCSACYGLCTAEFFYSCGENGCDFQLHVPCATISEPLIHESHTHPLFLTSKPGERRMCWACKNVESCATKETFNCIEECDFALCFVCATLPQKVMYKHDKHILTLCFGKETNTLTYWCEVCEEKIMSKERFYMCDVYCCVTIHIKCMLGEDLYMKPGSLWNHYNRKVSVLTNNHMSRPTCSNCKKRCPHKTVLEEHGLIFCGQHCCRLSLQ